MAGTYPSGYAGKVLRIDLATERIGEERVDEATLRKYLGGTGLGAKILYDEVPPEVDWDHPENRIIFGLGPLNGIPVAGSGSYCVVTKGPLTGGGTSTQANGDFGAYLKFSGYDAVILQGIAKRWLYLYVHDNTAELRDATHLVGKDTYEIEDLIKKELGKKEKQLSVVGIGPGGENLVKFACIIGDKGHAAAHNGVGAVMGVKRLKAIAIKGTGPLPEVANMGRVEKLIQRVCDNAYDNVLWRRWGTGSGGYEVGAKTSSEPVRNWQDEWHDKSSFGVDQFENRVWVKQCWSDFGCPANCLKIAVVRAGKFKGSMTDNPDYELQAYLGPNLGIFTPEENVHLASVVDDLGLCGIQTGNVLGFAAELFQRKILTTVDLDGLRLKWGDAEAFAALTKRIAFREGIGDLLAEGTYRAALKIEEMKKTNVLPYAVQSKGIGIGAHGIRSRKDYPEMIAYACSVQGGDHTSTAALPLDGPGSELMEIFNDSGVYCNFNGFGIPRKLKFEFYAAVTGIRLSRKEWCFRKALRILHMQRAMLLIGGPDLKWKPRIDDDNPPRFYEPLPSGPYKGRTTDKAAFEKYKRRYYRAVGWDNNGIPNTETLRKLALEDVDKALERIR